MESLGGKLGDNFSISGRPFVNMLSAGSVCLLNEHNIYVNGADRRGAFRREIIFCIIEEGICHLNHQLFKITKMAILQTLENHKTSIRHHADKVYYFNKLELNAVKGKL